MNEKNKDLNERLATVTEELQSIRREVYDRLCSGRLNVVTALALISTDLDNGQFQARIMAINSGNDLSDTISIVKTMHAQTDELWKTALDRMQQMKEAHNG